MLQGYDAREVHRGGHSNLVFGKSMTCRSWRSDNDLYLRLLAKLPSPITRLAALAALSDLVSAVPVKSGSSVLVFGNSESGDA